MQSGTGSVAEDYFSIDAILCAEPRVYSVLRVSGHTLRHLDPLAPTSSDIGERDLPAGHRVAIPFWLASALAERALADVELPRCYSGPTRAALRADATAVDLRSRCARYFALGVSLASLLRVPDLPRMLLAARAARAWSAVDAGAHASQRVLRTLDVDETKLFFAARAAAVARTRWKERTSARISAAPALLGKRKAPAVVSPVGLREHTRARVV